NYEDLDLEGSPNHHDNTHCLASGQHN
ncbi:unnamed protein product, partial [Rotaria magnacalcarata]